MIIHFSVVNHGNSRDIDSFLQSFTSVFDELEDVGHKVVITVVNNQLSDSHYRPADKKVFVINNASPHGFGKNHNIAFASRNSDYFIVCNPDIVYVSGDVTSFFSSLDDNPGVCAPLISERVGSAFNPGRSKVGIVELVSRFLRLFVFNVGNSSTRRLPQEMAWIPGVFMVFNSRAYDFVKGFDESLFMYYEDADICRKLLMADYHVSVNEGFQVGHVVGRGSARSFRLLFSHIRNAIVVNFFRKWKV